MVAAQHARGRQVGSVVALLGWDFAGRDLFAPGGAVVAEHRAANHTMRWGGKLLAVEPIVTIVVTGTLAACGLMAGSNLPHSVLFGTC